MSICHLDARKAVLDRINDEFAKDRPTFNRVADDIFEITNERKAQDRKQAWQIGQNLIARAKELFKGGVDGYITEYSDYEPLRVNFMVSEGLINKYLVEASKQTEIVEDSSFNKGEGIDEFGDSVFFQRGQKKGLNEKLISGFLKDFGIDVQKYKSIKEALGYNSTQMVDLISKFVAINEGESLDKAVAYIAYNLLGKENSKIKSELNYRIRSWSGYKNSFEKNRNEVKILKGYIEDSSKWYKLIKERVIIDFISESIVKYYNNPTQFEKIESRKWTKDDFTFIQKLYREILRYLERIGIRNKNPQILNNISANIANEILNQEYDIFNYNLSEDQILKNYQSTIDKDKFAKDIVEFNQNKGIILTGSLALRYAGSVYREESESLHDLDFVVPYELTNTSENSSAYDSILKLQEQDGEKELTISYIQDLDWYKEFKKQYPSFRVVNSFYGGEHDAYQSYTITGVINGELDQKGKYIDGTGYVVDFFVRLKPNQEQHENYFKLWKEIMIAKLLMRRKKDLVDYKAFVPFLKSKDSYNFYYKDWVYQVLENNNNYSQREGIQQSKASPSTIKKLKTWLDKSNIKIQDLDTLRFGGVNGVALTLEKIVQIAEGKENVALAEEAMHILTSMVKVGNKTLYNNMVNNVHKYQMYKDTLEEYQTDPHYMNENGTPNILKIKEEAVGKILAEYYIGQFEDTNKELLARTDSWWRQLIDWIKKLLHINGNPYLKTIKDIDQYISSNTVDSSVVKNLAERIQEKVTGILSDSINQSISNGDYTSVVAFIGNQLSDFDSYDATVNALQGDKVLAEEVLNIMGEFKQISSELFKTLDDKIQKFNLQKVEDRKDPEDESSRSYYTATIDSKTVITDRTTEWVKDKIKKQGGKDFSTEDADKLKYWDKIAMGGTNGHFDLEQIIKASLENDNTLKSKPDLKGIKPTTNPAIFSKLKIFLLGNNTTKGFLRQFPEGTKFKVEQKILNENARTKRKNSKGETKELIGRAGTIDLIVELPNGNIKIYDWKFMGFLLNKPDQHHMKRRQHELQLRDYVDTLKNSYGLKNRKIEAFTVPIHAEYQDIIDKDTKERVPILNNVTMGETVLEDEERTPLIPTTPEGQSTGNPEIDELITKLKGRYKRLYNKKVTTNEEIEAKSHELTFLSGSIRNLLVGINFGPLSVQAKNFQKKIEAFITTYSSTNFNELSVEQREKVLSELLELYNTADYYSNLDDIFLNQYPEKDLSEKRKNLLNTLRETSSTTRNEVKRLTEILNSLAETIAKNEGFSNILSAEKEVDSIVNSFSEGTLIPHKVTQLITKLNLDKSSEIEIKSNNKIKEFNEIYLKLQDLAKKKGKKAFDLLTDGKHGLFYKYKSDIFDKKNKAIENKELAWIKKNINIEEYKRLSKETIDRKISYIEEHIYNNDPKINQIRRNQQKINIRRAFDISRNDFNGWNDPTFKFLITSTLNLEGQESERWIEAQKPENKPILDAYNWIEKFNEHLIEIGYLENKHKSKTFLPFIKSTILQKLTNSNNKGETIRNLLSDIAMVDVNDVQSYGLIDPETGEQTKAIPRFFTIPQREGENSTDLLKIMDNLIKASYEFEGATELEDTFHLLLKVEQNKGHLETNKGEVIFEGDKPKVFKGNEKNIALVEKTINDYIYGISQGTDTLIDSVINQKTSGTEEEKQQKALKAKKLLQYGNIWTQQLAVGLKLLVAIPNYFGVHFQSIINSGSFFKTTEYEKNHLKAIASMVSNGKFDAKRVALLNMIVPLNEDAAKESIRHTAWKEGLSKWIGTWSFNDVLMSSNSIPDKTHQITNALSWIDNTMLDENGNLVNIRQHVKQKYKGRYSLSQTERKELEKKMESEIEELKNSKSLPKIANFDGDKLSILGLDENSLPAYRTKIVEFGRYLTGQMSKDNKSDSQRNILIKSFMMFKNWIPKQVSLRAADIRKNPVLDEWEYGRMRLFLKTISHLGVRNITKMRDIITGSDKGLGIMREVLAQKKEDYYKRAGQELEITEEEFFDMMRKELQAEVKELSMLLSILALVLLAKIAAPDDDDDDITKNHYKFLAKSINKISDELLFYYNPLSMESITRGTILPSLGLLSKTYNIFKHTMTEGFAFDFDKGEFFSEEVREKNKTLKYWMNLVPVASQFQNEILPIIDPEMAKELGIRLTVEARAMR